MLECGGSPLPKQEASAWRGQASTLQSGSVVWDPAWPLLSLETLVNLASLSLGVLVF